VRKRKGGARRASSQDGCARLADRGRLGRGDQCASARPPAVYDSSVAALGIYRDRSLRVRRGIAVGDDVKANLRFAGAAAAITILLAPAIWNGFPFLEYDSGGYLARWFEGYLVPSRSTVYGLFAVAGWPLDFWPEMLLQAAAAVWIISLVLRAYDFGNRPVMLIGVVAALAAMTSLPWLAGILLTDIFAGTAVLGSHLLLFAPASLNRRETIALVLLIGFAAATHSATLAVLMAIVVVASLARLRWPYLLPIAALGRSVVALILGAAMLLGTNFALSGQIAWTPGGYGIAFARMMEDGIVARYLADHCPEERLKLCRYRYKLPRTADEFLWGDSPFNELGRFAGLGDEMRKIVLESLFEYPGQQVEAAATASAKQLVAVASGEGVHEHLAHLRHHRAIHARRGAGDARRAPATWRGDLPYPERNSRPNRPHLDDPFARRHTGQAPRI
jgi:hypothetical protein